MSKHIEWIRQLYKVHQGEVVICPACGSNHTRAEFYRNADGVGFGILSGKECNDSAHLSRIKFPHDTKANITDI